MSHKRHFLRKLKTDFTNNLHHRCQIDAGSGMPNFLALATTVWELWRKRRWGGGGAKNAFPPSANGGLRSISVVICYIHNIWVSIFCVLPFILLKPVFGWKHSSHKLIDIALQFMPLLLNYLFIEALNFMAFSQPSYYITILLYYYTIYYITYYAALIHCTLLLLFS